MQVCKLEDRLVRKALKPGVVFKYDNAYYVTMPMRISDEYNAVNLETGLPAKIKGDTKVNVYHNAKLILADY